MSPEIPSSAEPTVPKVRRSVLHRAIFDSSLLVIFTTVLLACVAFLVTHALMERRVLLQTAALATVEEDIIDQTISTSRQKVALLANEPTVRGVIEGTAKADELDVLLIELTSEDDAIVGVSIFDMSGTVRGASGEPIETPEAFPDATIVLPQFREPGDESYDVLAPITVGDAGQQGVVVVRYDASDMLRPIMAALSALGRSAETYIGYEANGEFLVFRPTSADLQAHTISLGSVHEQLQHDLPLALGLLGEEGVGMGYDHRGILTLTAYRSLPSLGWGLVVQIDRKEVYADVSQLTFILACTGALLTLLGIILSYFLGIGLTKNLRSLAQRVQAWAPQQGPVVASVRSGDEVEVLDQVFSRLSERLVHIYDRLEEEVQVQTREALELYALDRAIIDGIDYGVITVDAEGLIQECNPTGARLLGYVRESLSGNPATSLISLQAKGVSLTGPEHPIQQCLARREVVRSHVSQRLCLLRPQGQPLAVNLTVSPLVVQDRLQGAVAVFQDVTEERQVDAMKSEFVSLASHQLRTPIAALRWYIELLDDGQPQMTEEKMQYLGEMRASVERTINLLNTLLQSAKLDEGGIEPHLGEVDLVILLRQLSGELTEMAARYGAQQTLSLPGEPCVTSTDETLLSIVIHNLLTNAIKYSRKGQGHVWLALKADGSEWEITVRDDGIGIPEEEQARLFEKFFRASNARTIDTDGNGLGLHIAQAMVSRLGGRMTFESRSGKGTTFIVRLPRQRLAQVA